MLQNRRRFLKTTLLQGSGFLAAACLCQSGRADCKSETRKIALGGTRTKAIPDWKLGNCELKDATLTLNDVGQRGLSLTFKGQVCTHMTHSKDVWHLHIKVIQILPTPQVVLVDTTINGPQMSERDNPLFHTWTATILLDVSHMKDKPTLEAQLTSCC